jgi:hypothetical protein
MMWIHTPCKKSFIAVFQYFIAKLTFEKITPLFTQPLVFVDESGIAFALRLRRRQAFADCLSNEPQREAAGCCRCSLSRRWGAALPRRLT